MKLTKAQSETLREMYAGWVHGPAVTCKIGYKPAKKLVELGFAKVKESTQFFWMLSITEKGREHCRRAK